MPIYTYRCPTHGDFAIESSMADTTPSEPCPTRPTLMAFRCGHVSPKVLCGNLQFTYGKSNFHDGPEGKGLTIRETADQWRKDFKAMSGREAEPTNRWV